MKKHICWFVIISFSVVFFSGCATDPNGNLILDGKTLGLALGTVAGAGAGAAIGGKKHRVAGAIIGGVAGAVLSSALINLSKKAVLIADKTNEPYQDFDENGNRVVARPLSNGNGYEECKWISREIFDANGNRADYSKEKVCEGRIVQTVKG